MFNAICQSALFAQANKPVYQLIINYVGKDTAFITQPLQLQHSFTDKISCDAYISQLISYLNNKGYPTASIDNIEQTDSATTIQLFLGRKYQWIKLIATGIDKRALDLSRFREKNFWGKPINMQQLQFVQQRLLNYYENNGHPFAAVYLDSVNLKGDSINALLKIKKGVLYKIDSIRQYGSAKMSNKFLQHYLDIYNGSVYSKVKLLQISKLLLNLPYIQEVQPNDITMLGSGSVVNLYLAAKKSSQISAIVGFLPSASQTGKMQITGDVNLNLKNALGIGEAILFTWQQLQTKSPRLNLGYQQPYIFNTKFGIDFLFDLFKKDSSFLQLQAQFGLQYVLSANQSGKIFAQWQNSFLLASGVDTNFVKATKKLPPNIDVSAVNVGLDYEWNKTDYKLNPRSGNDIKITASVGIKNIKKNDAVLSIKDPLFNYATLYDSVKTKSYQFKIKLSAAHYIPLGKQATIKTALNAGWYNSPNMFRNELFQIGGYRLLRGFNEESIFATQYAVATAEYRYRLGLNSNLFGFVDVGWVKNKYQSINVNNNFAGTGLGLLFETKFGLLNISYALGKRNDVTFNIREASKIHFGYINYF
ncbi:MAG: BamA/TamA family outer membrane protein [Chitinophagaceae bacterium]|nr:BamA/TamA family outer membrane protein [Chitinophagaceae bacterium]